MWSGRTFPEVVMLPTKNLPGGTPEEELLLELLDEEELLLEELEDELELLSSQEATAMLGPVMAT